jgi:hypothetical protein
LHDLIQRLASVAIVSVCLAIASAATAQDPPPPPPPPSDQDRSERSENDQRRDDARRNAAASHVVRKERGISKTRYRIGGIVGTYCGLGIGHAISGEYSSTGWIFTLGEIGSIFLLGYGLTESLGTNSTNPDAGEAKLMAGAVAFSVFRVVEVVDVWTRPTVASVRQPSDTAFAVGPVGDEGGLGALFQMRW